MSNKLSILILSSNTYPSVRNSKIQKKIFYNQKNGTKEIYWYKQGAEEILKGKNAQLVNKDLFINADDSSIGMGYKTIMAFEWLLENSDFEYLFRTNTSSYVSIDNLKKFIKNNYNDVEYLYSGLVHSTNDKNKKKIDFASGSGYLLNRNAVELIVREQEDWDHDYWDDVSLGLLMRKNKILPLPGYRFDIKGNVFKQELDLESYHFRCRIDNHYKYPRFLEKFVLKHIASMYSNNSSRSNFKTVKSFIFEVSRVLYIQQFGWKVFMTTRRLLRKVLPPFIYLRIKQLLSRNITNFKLKRFKT